ncbi:FtsW/RodA/SpoVE family cell cycle protein [Geotoga petraea]|jgi:rod shape determining protein RodA|uniref:Rod shape-determining protein RodA n=1 Tax=Geotoga petraea TaxID=28234 RepID=A0A4Z0W387_9BACT|nr:FtsW/RodA/SpoVE family cell cycle protein [Geotoga petraea]TGG88463.1 rod shape-determining protein RodA [Geotoga petraea]
MSLLKIENVKTRERFVRFEYILTILFVLLMVIGYFAVKSSTLNSYLEGTEQRQLFFYIIGSISFFIILFLPERTIKTLIPTLFFVLFFLLIAVLIIGDETKGARRWLNIGTFGIQPSEFFKLSLILYLSKVLSDNSKTNYYLVSLITIMSAGLIYLEPDLGTTLIIIMIWFVFTFLSGKFEVLWRIILFSGAALAPLAFLIMEDYQRGRIIGFMFPNLYSDFSYNTTQSIRAIASGGITGTGYMNGYMNLGNFVPEDHTDFIISVIGEEFGFIGIFSIIFTYFLIIWRLYRGYKMSYDIFWKYFYAGASFLIFFHVFENIGMNLGIMPVTGIPLPMISNGGSTIITYSLLLGLAVKGMMLNKNLKR